MSRVADFEQTSGGVAGCKFGTWLLGAREAGIVPCPCMIACLASTYFGSWMRALYGCSGLDCPFSSSVSSGSYSAFLLHFLFASFALLYPFVSDREYGAFEANGQYATELEVNGRLEARTGGLFLALVVVCGHYVE